MTRNSNLIRTAALGVMLALPADLAMAAVAQGDFAGKNVSEITAQLQQQGYTVLEVETEDSLFEAFAELDGKTFEIYVDSDSGKVLKVKLDD